MSGYQPAQACPWKFHNPVYANVPVLEILDVKPIKFKTCYVKDTFLYYLKQKTLCNYTEHIHSSLRH